MGLFGKRAAVPVGQLGEADAFVGIAFCSMYADGVLGAEEQEELADYLADFSVLRALDDEAVRASFQRVDRIAREEGEQALLEKACAAVPPRLRATAFYLAADLVLADGEVAREEKDFLEGLRQALGVSEEVAVKIIEVIAIKNLG